MDSTIEKYNVEFGPFTQDLMEALNFYQWVTCEICLHESFEELND